MPVHEGLVDDVRTFWSGSADPSRPTTATLLFRTGRVDETLRTNGTSQLVQRAALLGLDELPGVFRAEGRSGTAITSFEIEGSPEGVEAALAELGTRLTDLPEELVERARRDEDFMWPGALPTVQLLRRRFGAQGPGLQGLEPLGAELGTPDAVAAWARTRFGRDDAVLAVDGSLPPATQLGLPRVARRAPSPVVDQVGGRSGWLPVNSLDGIAHLVVERSPAARAWRDVVARRLQSRLNIERPDPHYLQLWFDDYDAASGGLTIVLPWVGRDTAADIARVIEVLDHLAADGPTEDELETCRAAARLGRTGPDRDTLAQRAALDVLLGSAPTGSAAPGDDLPGVTAEGIVAAARSAGARLVLGLREEPAALTARFPDLSGAASRREVIGDFYAYLLEDGVRVSVNDVALSVRGDHGEVDIVELSTCAGCLAWPTGARHLIGQDGENLWIDPRHWVRGVELVARIDSLTEHVRITMPAPSDVVPSARGAGPVEPQFKPPFWRRPIPAWALLLWVALGLAVAATGESPIPPPISLILLGAVALAAIVDLIGWRADRAARRNAGVQQVTPSGHTSPSG